MLVPSVPPANLLVHAVGFSASYQQFLQDTFTRFLPDYTFVLFPGGSGFAQQLPTLTKPGLLLLDNELPDMDRCELVHQLRQHAQWRYVPVVIMSNGEKAEDIASCYGAGANSFVVKPTDQNAARQIMQSLCYYWFELNQSASL